MTTCPRHPDVDVSAPFTRAGRPVTQSCHECGLAPEVCDKCGETYLAIDGEHECGEKRDS